MEISAGRGAGSSPFHSGLDEVSAISTRGAGLAALRALAISATSRTYQRLPAASLGGLTKLAGSGTRRTPMTESGARSAAFTGGRAEMVSATKPRSTRMDP